MKYTFWFIIVILLLLLLSNRIYVVYSSNSINKLIRFIKKKNSKMSKNGVFTYCFSWSHFSFFFFFFVQRPSAMNEVSFWGFLRCTIIWGGDSPTCVRPYSLKMIIYNNSVSLSLILKQFGRIKRIRFLYLSSMCQPALIPFKVKYSNLVRFPISYCKRIFH